MFYATIFIPRSIWVEKPMPFAQYITCAALNNPPEFLGWGLTNSIFDELICNLGLWSILLFPYIIIGIIKFGYSAHNRFASIFTILVVCLLFSVEITAYFTFYLAYIAFIVFSRRMSSEKRIKKLSKSC